MVHPQGLPLEADLAHFLVPLTTHHSLTTHYSLPTTYYLLPTTHHSPLTTHRLLLTHYSLLTTHYSLLLTAHYLLLTTYYFPLLTGLVHLLVPRRLQLRTLPTRARALLATCNLQPATMGAAGCSHRCSRLQPHACCLQVLNLSVGGPDFADLPFTRKVSEVAAHNVLIVSGIGNSGPLWGTLMNPADQPEVLGVGGIDDEGRLAPFSSRGMSGWELPDGAGRVKPDIVTYGSRVSGSGISGGCRELSGTSVACPVVAGAAALLASTLPEARRSTLLNPASLRQVLAQAAARLPGRSAFEQGAGSLHLLRSAQALTDYTPHASVVPEKLDLSPCGPAGEGGAGHAPGGGGSGSGGYLWPYCSQPLYAGAVPLLINLTLLNGMSVVGNFSRPPLWVPRGAADGEALHVGFEHRRRLWPWGGTLGVALSVPDAAAAFDGLVRGAIVFEVGALLPGDPSPQPRSAISVPLIVRVVPTPPRARRLLFDARHNLRYPPAYLPRDNLQVRILSPHRVAASGACRPAANACCDPCACTPVPAYSYIGRPGIYPP